MMKRTIFHIKIFLILFYTFLAIGIEVAYRDVLFEKSFDVTKKLQNHNSKSFDDFCRVFTNFGGAYFNFSILFIIFLYYPLNKTYCFLNVLLTSMYVNNALKFIYAQSRPFWMDPTLLKFCEGGWGNPSGHAMNSICTFLSLWKLFTDYKCFEKKYISILKYLILVLFIIIALLVDLSRLYLGVTSLNQLLYGFSIGLSIYYLYFHILYINKTEPKTFFRTFFNKRNNIVTAIIFVIEAILPFLLYFFTNTDKIVKYNPILEFLCPNIPFYRKLNADALFLDMNLFFVIGSYYGLVFLLVLTKIKYRNKEREIIYWNRVSPTFQIVKFLMTIFFMAPFLMYILIPFDLHFGIIFTFKTIIPLFLLGFFEFGINIYLMIILKIANPKIYEPYNNDIPETVIIV